MNIITMNGFTAWKFNGEHWAISRGRYGRYVEGFEDVTDFTKVIDYLTYHTFKNGKIKEVIAE